MADLFVSGGIVTALEDAAVAVGRLDAALAGNPLRRAWTFWSELDAARRHAEADGRKVDLYRLPPPPPRPPPRPAAPARRRRFRPRARRRDHQPELRHRAALLDGRTGCRAVGPGRCP